MGALTRLAARAAGGAFLAGAATLGYSLWEARQYTLRRVTVPTLPPGSPEVRVLHLSDIHLVPTQTRKLAWLRSLAGLNPDLVVDTGDNLSHRDAVGPLVDALAPLLRLPGVFVRGSNDYFEPQLKNPFAYVTRGRSTVDLDRPQLPWRTMTDRFLDAGWTELTNRTDSLLVKDLKLAFAGVDDPHLGYDRLDAVAGPADASADVRLGVAHAPYLRVLDQFARDGYDGILAGHTHGGQVCLPFAGPGLSGRALTTNCDLDAARAKGLSSHEDAWLHVSAGVGTSPYFRMRLACRPEATLLTLTARPAAKATERASAGARGRG